jgi:integrase
VDRVIPDEGDSALRNDRAARIRIERDNLKHLLPQFGRLLVTDIEAHDIKKYQLVRLTAEASPKTVNLEVGTLRAILRRNRAWAAVVLALSTAMRYSEIRLLRWGQIDFLAAMVTVGKSKTINGTGRVIPLNVRARTALGALSSKFQNRLPEHYVFPAEKYGAAGDRFTPCFYKTDPTRPIGDWKEAWEAAKRRAK